ncbi:hypothetical protein QTP86_000838 [Hemibagrus guttatus]|nr:hypothetical protein QTP86_000838 [Hemibagrus guttatus]
MADGKHITGFLKNRAGNLGICSLVLVILEELMDNDFVCPCQPAFNEWICVCYAIVPSIACFFITLCFIDLKPEDTVMKGNSVCSKVLYSFLISFIWLFLFFFDGRYMACACSYWDGEYTETDSLKWCKPKGNESEVFKRQKETERITSKRYNLEINNPALNTNSTLSQYISMAGQSFRCRTEVPSPKEEYPKPMQLRRFRLSEKERQHRAQMLLCFYCGQSGHQIQRCPEKPSTSQVDLPSSNGFTTVMVIIDQFSRAYAAFGVNVHNRGKRDSDDLFSCPHYPLQGLAVRHGAISEPGSDAAAQDALDGVRGGR